MLEEVRLNADGTFVAYFDTVNPPCWGASFPDFEVPCPSATRVEGRYTATNKVLRLVASPGATPGPYHGVYAYTSVGATLTFTRADWPGWYASSLRWHSLYAGSGGGSGASGSSSAGRYECYIDVGPIEVHASSDADAYVVARSRCANSSACVVQCTGPWLTPR